jgi:hypothetical protein
MTSFFSTVALIRSRGARPAESARLRRRHWERISPLTCPLDSARGCSRSIPFHARFTFND